MVIAPYHHVTEFQRPTVGRKQHWHDTTVCGRGVADLRSIKWLDAHGVALFLLKTIRNEFVTKNSNGPTVKANVLATSHAFLYTGKRNVKFTLQQAKKAQSGSRGIVLLFLEPRR